MARTFSAREQEVLAANRERIAALVAGDADTLDCFVGDDMSYVSPAGQVQSKAQVFAALRSGALRLERQDASDLEVRLYGDTAIVGYRAETVTVDSGVRIEGTTRCTSVYVHRDGRWQLVLQHNTFVR
jgi:uncharacterized protein (TIGR02246 family)